MAFDEAHDYYLLIFCVCLSSRLFWCVCVCVCVCVHVHVHVCSRVCFSGQVAKVEKFKQTQSTRDCLHAKFHNPHLRHRGGGRPVGAPAGRRHLPLPPHPGSDDRLWYCLTPTCSLMTCLCTV